MEGRRKKVLLSDANVQFREILARYFGGFDDLEVVGCAGSAADTLDQARIHLPDVIVLDLATPGMRFRDLLGALRNEHPAASVVAVSVFDDDGYRTEALAAGAGAFVPKSEASDALIVAVRACAARPSTSPPPSKD